MIPYFDLLRLVKFVALAKPIMDQAQPLRVVSAVAEAKELAIA